MNPRVFGWPSAPSLVSLVVALLYGGPQALIRCPALVPRTDFRSGTPGILEIPLSFDSSSVRARRATTCLSEHDAHWATGALALVLLLGIGVP
jgi:hypothetical protein